MTGPRGGAGIAYITTPPFDEVRQQAQGSIAPVGGIIAYDSLGSVSVLSDVLDLHARAPWCPIVICNTEQIDIRALRRLCAWNEAIVVSSLDASALPKAASELRRTIERRALPDADDIATYVAIRLGRPAIMSTIKASIELSRDCDVGHRSTFNRRLSDLPPFKAHDWRAISMLAVTFQSHSSADQSVAACAYADGIDPRTLRSRLQRYIGRIESRLRPPGWEWLVETALRRFGYARYDNPHLGIPLSAR